MKTDGLKQALDKYQFDAAFGGARRDEENPELKKEFTHLGIKTTDGIQKTNALSYGIFTMESWIRGKASGFSHYQTGQNWISGNTFI